MSEQAAADYVVDKTGWGDGAWMTEPDREQWTHAGYACLILRHSEHGHWCGYVGVDAAHPFYGRKAEGLGIDAHGALNYAAKCEGNVCHVPEPGMPADVWWLGMDFGHAWDVSPGRDARLREWLPNDPMLGYCTYRTVEYVRQRTEHVADQLRAIATAGSNSRRPNSTRL